MRVFILFLFLLVSVASYAVECKISTYDETKTTETWGRTLVATVNSVVVTLPLKDKIDGCPTVLEKTDTSGGLKTSYLTWLDKVDSTMEYPCVYQPQDCATPYTPKVGLKRISIYECKK